MLGSDWEKLGKELGLSSHRVAQIAKADPDDTSRAVVVLRRWSQSVAISVDKAAALQKMCTKIGRPDLEALVRKKVQEFKAHMLCKVQDLNLVKAFNVLIRNTAVVAGWRDVALELSVPFGEVEKIANSPLNDDEKCFKALMMWRESGGATLEGLQKHLENLNHRQAAEKLADLHV
ncbi:uncharacterized protein LOC106154775 [Lingula anatina]|uniref:Uncharacterized protein LOC106154775 n=1 Tax=Lingula anatina TaxID=7574 RepID=A0A1S3HF60_LINAN|nr:uncharacterized protein LOC106154775 [Lingula anatina]|eukprot:XP_013384708.1 uncharacterized protein LOC106154775 [Lingula anatina]